MGEKTNLTAFLIGIAMAVAFPVVALVAAWKAAPNTGAIYAACLLGLLGGLALVFFPRLKKLNLTKSTGLELFKDQASAELEDIAKIKADIEEHAHEIGQTAMIAEEARTLVSSLEEKISEANAKLAETDKQLDIAAAAVQALSEESTFIRTLSAAQIDDRNAYDQLTLWAKDDTSPFKPRARAAYHAILDSHSQSSSGSIFTFPWPDGVDPSELSLEQWQSIYDDIPPANAFIKPTMLEEVSRASFPKKDKMDFFRKVIADDHSLKAVEHAGRYFLQLADLPWSPLAISSMADWWEKNKDQIE